MTPRDVVKAAALLAARHAYASLPESLVRWSDEPQSQAEGDYPQVTLSSVSHVPEGPMSLRRSVNDDGTLAQRMLQVWIWTVQIKCEGYKLDATDGRNPIRFAHRMRSGWYLQAVQAALLDPGSDASTRAVVKLVEEAGQILTLNQTVRGQTLPVLVYEVEFRYVDRDTDPTPVGVIESVELAGTIDGVAIEIDADNNEPEP